MGGTRYTAPALGCVATHNPAVPAEYLSQAKAEILTSTSVDAMTENHRVHNCLVDGFRGISYIDPSGAEVTPTIRLLSSNPDENEWLAINQVTVRQGDFKRRFDVVLYCNGMPLAIFELKKASSQSADVAAAHAQLQTYLREFPMAFCFGVCVVASDGIIAKYGTPFTPLNHFSPWNVDDDLLMSILRKTVPRIVPSPCFSASSAQNFRKWSWRTPASKCVPAGARDSRT
jgi:type I restriction enzyme, R subunit